jgi:flagellar biosynthesis/type III secretory pathway protein FliH
MSRARYRYRSVPDHIADQLPTESEIAEGFADWRDDPEELTKYISDLVADINRVAGEAYEDGWDAGEEQGGQDGYEEGKREFGVSDHDTEALSSFISNVQGLDADLFRRAVGMLSIREEEVVRSWLK